jgi:hypothetical protein
VDDNLFCIKRDNIVDLHWQGKFRGPDFEAMSFELCTATAPILIDSKGRAIPTVTAKALTEHRRSALHKAERSDQDEVLLYLQNNPNKSLRDIARGLGWFTNPDVSRVNRTLKGLGIHSKGRNLVEITCSCRCSIRTLMEQWISRVFHFAVPRVEYLFQLHFSSNRHRRPFSDRA